MYFEKIKSLKNQREKYSYGGAQKRFSHPHTQHWTIQSNNLLRLDGLQGFVSRWSVSDASFPDIHEKTKAQVWKLSFHSPRILRTTHHLTSCNVYIYEHMLIVRVIMPLWFWRDFFLRTGQNKVCVGRVLVAKHKGLIGPGNSVLLSQYSIENFDFAANCPIRKNKSSKEFSLK